MPRIPRGNFPQKIETPQMQRGPIAAPYAAMAEAGRDIERTALWSGGVFQRIQEAQDHVDALKYEHEFEADLNKKLEDYRFRTDYENYDKDGATDLEDLKNKYTGLIGDNSRVLDAFNESFQVHATRYSEAIRAKKAQDITKAGMFQAEQESDIAAQKYVQATSDEERSQIKLEYGNKLGALVKANVLPANYVYDHIKKFNTKAQQTELITGVNSNNPNQIQATIEKKFPLVDPVTEATLKAHGENRIDSLNKKIQAEVDKQKTTLAYNDLKRNITLDEEPDFNAMYKILGSKAFQEKHGLTVEQVHSLSIDLSSEEELARRQQQNIWRETAVKNFALKVDGKLTTNMIKHQVATKQISPQMGEAYLNDLGTGTESKTNPKFYIDTLNKLFAGKDITDDVNAAVGIGGLLSTSAAGHLLTLQHSMNKQGQEHYANDDWFKLSKQELSDFFGTVDISPEEALRLKMTGQPIPKKDFDGYTEALSTLMRSVELNNLKGEDIWNKTQELKKFYSMRKAQGATWTKPAIDQYGFTVGERRTNSKGETGEYIGNNQWRKVM